MKRFTAAIDIAATPAAIWAVLVDTGSWPSFDACTTRFEGAPAPGATITAYSTLAPGQAFPVRITGFEPARQLAWTVGLPAGMLKYLRTHTSSPVAGGCRFEVSEEVSGPMLPVIARALPDLDEAFAAFCAGFKARVETGSAPTVEDSAVSHRSTP